MSDKKVQIIWEPAHVPGDICFLRLTYPNFYTVGLPVLQGLAVLRERREF
ncbi:MAG: hypothetical protein JSW42_11135 [Chloroflexota bacterium]|nr:MAG: hypothetical protein JSW42_11135 [Chloroflexota bacterium]